jgi:excisionase family DNA binding protein
MSSKITITRICQNCGQSFAAHTTVTQCCSDRCAKAYYKKKKRTAKIEHSDREVAVVMKAPLEVVQAKEFLSINDTERLLGVSKSTVMRLLKNGRLPCAKLGRRTLISRAHIDQLFIQ